MLIFLLQTFACEDKYIQLQGWFLFNCMVFLGDSSFSWSPNSEICAASFNKLGSLTVNNSIKALKGTVLKTDIFI